MSEDDEDPFWLLHWPDESLLPRSGGEEELWSLMFVEWGLKDADLRPLAEHLKKGFPLSPRIAEMIASSIDGRANAPCQIRATRLGAGRPVGRARAGTNKHDALSHTEKMEIGIAAERALLGVKRPQTQVVMGQLCDRFEVSERTVKNARKYVKDWVANVSNPTEAR